MARKKQITKVVILKDIVLDKNIYPRETYSWQKAYEYSQAMISGSEFPKIIVGLYKGKLYLIDGKHRIEAKKVIKQKEDEVIVWIGLNMIEMYKMAIKLNAMHGLGLSVYDRRRAALKLFQMGSNSKEVSSLINVPEEKLQTFVEQRMVNTITGKPSNGDLTEMGNEILKTVMKHHAGESGNGASLILEQQKKVFIPQQKDLWKDAAFLLENKLVNDDDEKIMKYFAKVKTLIKNYKF